jgi:hypothetical protein
MLERTRILFRGQADARWPLSTTLERRDPQRYSVLQYLVLASRGLSELESFTGKTWQVPSFPELQRLLRTEADPSHFHLPAYEYLIYLRHHGFASPLLDWTESPYVAAFFALSDHTKVDRAIYCFVETPDGAKGGTVGDPTIHVHGPFVRSHVRHFAQRAWYTVAVEWDEVRREHAFVPHASVFRRNDPTQDVLIKIEVPAALRREGLRSLSDYNINQFTLFQSEDALVRMLESRAFELSALFEEGDE